MFRRTPIPRTVHLAVSFSIFSRYVLYGGQALHHSCIILSSLSRTRALRYLPMFLSNNAQNFRYVSCTLRPIRISHYSSWPKLLWTIAYLYRFLNPLRRSKNPQANIATLLPDEIQNAKRYWLKTMQSTMFPNEIAALTCLVPKKSSLYALNPYGREWICSYSGKTPSSLPPRSDEESHRFTRTPAVSTHYPAPSSTIFERCMPIN